MLSTLVRDLLGSGYLYVLDLSPENHLTLAVQTQWSDGLFDLAFAEDHPDIILTASGDGGIQLWDMKEPGVFYLLFNYHSQIKLLTFVIGLGAKAYLERAFERSLLCGLEPNKTTTTCSQLLVG